MSMFRSQKMGYFEIQMPRESTWDIMNALGKLSMLEFIDQNSKEASASFRYYYRNIKRCQDIESQIAFIQQQMDLYNIKVEKCQNVEAYMLELQVQLGKKQQDEQSFINFVETQVEQQYKLMTEQTNTLDVLRKNYINDSYKLQCLQYCEEFFKNHFSKNFEQIYNENLILMTGVITKDLAQRFHRQAFRATKGNVLIQLHDVEKIQNENIKFGEEKSMYLLIFNGGNLDVIRNKISRLLDAYNAVQFEVPQTQRELTMAINSIQQNRVETDDLYKLTQEKVSDLCLVFQQQYESSCDYSYSQSRIETYRIFVLKEKLIYDNMNTLSQEKESILTGSFWCPLAQEGKIENCMVNLQQQKPNLQMGRYIKASRPQGSVPPTYIKTNEFTAAFQEIVNTYGIPTYREVNPALFAIAMFPFKFGVMFGDIGHGGLLLLAGIMMCVKSDELKKVGMAEARYLVLLMGIFAFYCGIMYNDFFSLTTSVFSSCFEQKKQGSLDTIKKQGCTYPIGVDPIWYNSSNELSMFNSLKMKLAVIIGVLQMLFGLLMKLINHLHYKEWLDVFFGFIPQIIFLSSTFGYMIFMIFKKWTVDFTDSQTKYAPSIIAQLINLPLAGGQVPCSQGSKDEDPECFPLWDRESQENFQSTIFLLALCMVPLMLFPKPIFIYLRMSSKESHSQPKIESKELSLNTQLIQRPMEDDSDTLDEEHHDFGDIVVHSIIETIEFCLGCISCTASYLRLWALSLAHSQLSKVFFEKTIGAGIETGNPPLIIIGFFMWINVTFAVLMCMDLMECFLHALRLQWVEFQQKFYKGSGFLFRPFSFKQSLQI